jgi:hypothetical protein
LPEEHLAEVLELVSALENKEDHRETDDSTVWTAFSLVSAMENIDNDEDELYTLSDLKETYR